MAPRRRRDGAAGERVGDLSVTEDRDEGVLAVEDFGTVRTLDNLGL